MRHTLVRAFQSTLTSRAGGFPYGTKKIFCFQIFSCSIDIYFFFFSDREKKNNNLYVQILSWNRLMSKRARKANASSSLSTFAGDKFANTKLAGPAAQPGSGLAGFAAQTGSGTVQWKRPVFPWSLSEHEGVGTKAVNWEYLPMALKECIFTFLGPRSHASLGRVSRAFRNAALCVSASLFELRVDCNTWACAPLRDPAKSLQRWRPKRLVLIGTQRDVSNAKWANQLLQSTAQRNHILNDLDMREYHGTWNVDMLTSLGKLDNLRTLQLARDWPTSSELASPFIDLLRNLASLTNLELTTCVNFRTLHALKNRTQLRLLRVINTSWTEQDVSGATIDIAATVTITRG
jgi:hypothetical protein